jgi:hypothetical protein
MLLLAFDFSGRSPVGTPLTLAPTPTADGNVATDAPARTKPGSSIVEQPGEVLRVSDLVDTSKAATATATILALPKAEGERAIVRIQAHFHDGNDLDVTLSAPTRSGDACGP